MELNLEANEDSVNAKCEWNVVSWTNYDIRLDGNSPVEVATKFGFIIKNSWEDEATYQSQVMGWVNEQQVCHMLLTTCSFTTFTTVVTNIKTKENCCGDHVL